MVPKPYLVLAALCTVTCVMDGCRAPTPISHLDVEQDSVVRWRSEMEMSEMGHGEQTEDFSVHFDARQGELWLRDWGQRWSGGPEPRHFPGKTVVCQVPLTQLEELRRAMKEITLPVDAKEPTPSSFVEEPRWTICVVDKRMGVERCGTRYETEWMAIEGGAHMFKTLKALRGHALREGTIYPDDGP